jgi:two-component system NtrC family sensor kinase
MFSFPQSIRQKISFGYYSIVAAVVILSLFTFTELRFLENKIETGDVITEFFDVTLEVRRFEKNYFLYEQESDYRENMQYVDKGLELIRSNVQDFSSIARPERIVILGKDLKEYRSLMKRYAELSRREVLEYGDSKRRQKMILERDIRQKGKRIVTVAEDISKTERQHLQNILSSSQKILIYSIIFLSLVVIVAGQIMSRRIVRPLKLLEKSMQAIADGKFETIHIESKDREILSLTNAFTKMLKELELRQRHLIQSEKLASLGTLLSGVAHELNNPLSNISSSCQILMEEIDEPDMKFKNELLHQIDEQTDRARNIVRSLLDFSREKEFKKEALPLKSLFDETIRFVKGQVPTKVEIVMNIPDDITIYADKQRIQQAFLNLIKNAIEAISEEGFIFISAHTHFAVDKTEPEEREIYNFLKYHGKCTIEENTVDIKIRDTGSGIPKDLLPRVFDPFFSTKDVGRGSGLGLFIVYEIIEEHNGCIAVDSKSGEGTVFLIRLPMKP